MNALPFAELFERWSYDTPAFHNAVSPHSDISQVPPDDAVIHDNSLKQKPQTNKAVTQLYTDSTVSSLNCYSGVFLIVLLCH